MTQTKLLEIRRWLFYWCFASFSLGIATQQTSFFLFFLFQVGLAARYNIHMAGILDKGRRMGALLLGWIVVAALIAQARQPDMKQTDFHWALVSFWIRAPAMVREIQWERLHRVLLVLSVPGILHSVYWLLQPAEIAHALDIGFSMYPRAEGLVSNAITNAEGLAILACWSLARLSSKLSPRERRLILIHLLFSILIVVFSRVRSGILGFSVLMFLTALFSERSRRLSLIGLGVTIVLSIGAIAFFGFNMASIEERMILIRNSLKLWVQHPWVGIGPDRFTDYPLGGETITGHPHNTWLGIGVETGIVGIVIYTLFIILLGHRLWCLFRDRKQNPDVPDWAIRAMCSCFVMYLIFGIFDFNFADSELLLFHGLHWGLATQLWRNRFEEENREEKPKGRKQAA